MKRFLLLLVCVLCLMPLTSPRAEASWQDVFQGDPYNVIGPSNIYGNMMPPLDDINITGDFDEPREGHPNIGPDGKSIHGSIDFSAPGGTVVHAMAPGIAYTYSYMDGFGPTVAIVSWDYSGFIVTRYGHLGEIKVNNGDWVDVGTDIATVGSGIVGNSSGEHLHIDIYLMSDAEADAELIDTHGKVKQNPHDWCPALGEGGGGGGIAIIRFIWDATYNFGEPIKVLINDITEACVKGTHLLKDVILKIFWMLVVIDLTLGAALYVVDTERGNGIFKWLIYKLILYMILVYFLTNWASSVANLGRDFFISMGGSIMGQGYDDALKSVSDPLQLFQKGAEVIGPIIEEICKYNKHVNIVGGAAVMVFLGACLLVIGGAFAIITYQIILAYVEFYVIMMFSFVMFMFSGVKYTRYLAANTLAGIFAISVKLMFFTLFSLLLQTSMKSMTYDPIFTKSTMSPAIAIGGNFGGPEGVHAYAAALLQVEGGGKYDVYYGGGKEPPYSGAAFGAYQFNFWADVGVHDEEKYKRWAQEYMDALENGDEAAAILGGPLAPSAEYGGTEGFPNDPNHYTGYGYAYSPWNYSPENQDKVAKYQMLKIYQDTGSWKAVDDAWGGFAYPDHWANVCKAAANGKPMQVTVANLVIVVKIMTLVLMFLIMGDHLSEAVLKNIETRGFVFTDYDKENSN